MEKQEDRRTKCRLFTQQTHTFEEEARDEGRRDEACVWQAKVRQRVALPSLHSTPLDSRSPHPDTRTAHQRSLLPVKRRRSLSLLQRWSLRLTSHYRLVISGSSLQGGSRECEGESDSQGSITGKRTDRHAHTLSCLGLLCFSRTTGKPREFREHTYAWERGACWRTESCKQGRKGIE